MTLYDSLVAITIGQLFFVHERGTRMCIWGVFEVAGAVLGPLVNGYVIQNLSWRLGFWFVSIACGICFVAAVLFVRETTYRGREPSESPGQRLNATAGNIDLHNDLLASDKATFRSHLKIYNGTFCDETVWRIFLRPFPLLLSPVACARFLIGGGMRIDFIFVSLQTWFALLSYLMPGVFLGLVLVCSSTIFTVTYGFNTAQIGLTNLGGLVGSVIGIAVAGPLGDWWIVWVSRRNRGVYEPEVRHQQNLLVGAFGYVGWAVGNDHHMPWVGAVACIAMIYFGALVPGVALFPYLIDAHGSNSLHIISLINFAKNVLIYGSAFFANGIILSAGVKLSLIVYGACQAACWLTCIPMYVYGKRARSFIARHPNLFRGDVPAPDLSPNPSPSAEEESSKS
uniref:Multidrug transporter TPO1_2 (Clotrimazole exporter TPO1_2) (Drug:H(+) antiporter TPO1_2) (DHA TPO1_2) n=1 Tax=Ganoderma boninense TaxID=34458 RepID=A0A5K1JR52_9APHY|nr:Multidrug transporter TPO1_2 (Clotrimazole exporter TPO1_2) (Drug:H(+) antiporter TPO1_2) (DHA TPO1_2) [Ganoderma boninense]